MESTDSGRGLVECWNRAVYAYATATIFQVRSQRYRRQLRTLSFGGIAIPLIVGAVVLAFGSTGPYLPLIIATAATLGILQVIVSAWSIVYGWTDNLEYSLESSSENFELSTSFRQIAEAALPLNEEVRFGRLKVRDDVRRAADSRKGITQKELRYGHRAGLRQFMRACSGCGKIPQSLRPSSCKICGDF